MSTTASRAADLAGPVTLIHAGYVVPVRPRGEVLEAHTVAISGDLIAGVLPRDEAMVTWPDADHVELPGHVLLPGLINAHTHLYSALARGLMADIAPSSSFTEILENLWSSGDAPWKTWSF